MTAQIEHVPGDGSAWWSLVRAALRSAVCRCPRRFDAGEDGETTPSERARETDPDGRDAPRTRERCGAGGWWYESPGTVVSDARAVPARSRAELGGSACDDIYGAHVHALPGQTWRCDRCGHVTRTPGIGAVRYTPGASWAGHGGVPEGRGGNDAEDAVIAWIDDRLPQIRRERDHAEAPPHRRADRSRSR